MQVLSQEHKPEEIIQSIKNVLFQQALPLFSIKDEVLPRNRPEIRGLSQINRVTRKHQYEEAMFKEKEKMEKEEDVSYDVDDKIQPVVMLLVETTNEAEEKYKYWRNPPNAYRSAQQEKIDENLKLFETVKCKVYAEDIVGVVDKLVSMGISAKNFIAVEEVPTKGQIQKIQKGYREVYQELCNAKDSDKPRYLSKLITCVRPYYSLTSSIVEEEVVEPELQSSNTMTRVI